FAQQRGREQLELRKTVGLPEQRGNSVHRQEIWLVFLDHEHEAVLSEIAACMVRDMRSPAIRSDETIVRTDEQFLIAVVPVDDLDLVEERLDARIALYTLARQSD